MVAQQDSAPPGAMTHLRIDSGMLYTRSGVPMHLAHALVRIAKGMKPTDGNKNDIVFLDAGQVGLTSDSLGRLLRAKMQGRGVEDLSVTTEGNEVKISGKMKKVVSVPISIQGPLNVTSDGKLQLATRKMKSGKLPIKGLADALGMNVSHIVGNDKKGVKSEGDTIIFDPDELWGLPVHGHLTRALVQKNGLLLIFGAPAPAPKGHHLLAGK